MTISSFEQILELDWAWGKKIIIFRITHNYLKVILLVKLSLLYMKSLGASNCNPTIFLSAVIVKSRIHSYEERIDDKNQGKLMDCVRGNIITKENLK